MVGFAQIVRFNCPLSRLKEVIIFNNSKFTAVKKNGFDANGGFEPPPLWLRHCFSYSHWSIFAARPLPSCGVSPSVCPSARVSVTFVHSVKTNKHIFIFSPSGSHAILVFPYQTGWRYSDGNPPNGEVECRWCR